MTNTKQDWLSDLVSDLQTDLYRGCCDQEGCDGYHPRKDAEDKIAISKFKQAIAKQIEKEVVEARMDEVKMPIAEYNQAELDGKSYDFYFALRTRLDQLKDISTKLKEE